MPGIYNNTTSWPDNQFRSMSAQPANNNNTIYGNVNSNTRDNTLRNNGHINTTIRNSTIRNNGSFSGTMRNNNFNSNLRSNNSFNSEIYHNGHFPNLTNRNLNIRNQMSGNLTNARPYPVSRSHVDLSTMDSRPTSQMQTHLLQADPELKDIVKTGADYHITLNLPANLLAGTNNENYDASTYERNDFEEVILNGPQMGLDDDVFATLKFDGMPKKSVVNIKNDEPPLQIKVSQQRNEVVVAKPAAVNKFIKTATVNVVGAPRSVKLPVNVGGQMNEVRGGFVVKSIVPSPARPELGFDLLITGGETSQIIESRTMPRPLPEISSTKRIEERKVRRIIQETPTVVRRARQEIPEPRREKKKIEKPRVKKHQEVQKVVKRAPVRSEPEVRQELRQITTVEEKRESIPAVAVEIPIVEVQKAIPIQVPAKKVEKEYVREIKINTAKAEPQPVDEVDDSNYVTSQVFIERLMRGAPAGSLQQKVNVEREEEVIVGPLSQYEVEQMYAQSMINVDTVSEKVDLTLSNGIANLLVKVRNEKIVPIRGSGDHFKKSAVIVTRLIDVDLNVTSERREIQHQIMENQTRGRLNNRYTFELYKAFLAMADADSGYSGQVPQQVVIEKKVDEQNLWDLRRTGKLSTSEDQIDARFSEIEDSDQNLRNLVAANKREGFDQGIQWDRSDSWYQTPRSNINNNENGARATSMAMQANANSSQWMNGREASSKYENQFNGGSLGGHKSNNQRYTTERSITQSSTPWLGNNNSSYHSMSGWQSGGGNMGGSQGGGYMGGSQGGCYMGGSQGGEYFKSSMGASGFAKAKSSNESGGYMKDIIGERDLGSRSNVIRGNSYMRGGTRWMGNQSSRLGGHSAQNYELSNMRNSSISGNQLASGEGRNEYSSNWSQMNAPSRMYSDRRALSEMNLLNNLEANANLEEFYNSGRKSSRNLMQSNNGGLVLEEEPIEKELLVRRFKIQNVNGHDTMKSSSKTNFGRENDHAPRLSRATSSHEISKTNYSNAYVPRKAV